MLFFDIREEPGDDAKQGQEGGQLEYVLNAGTVGQPAEEGGTDAAQAEGEAEECPRDHAYIAGQEFGGVDEDGGHGRRHDHADEDDEDDGPSEVAVRQQEGEGRRAEDADPDDVLAPVAVADLAADEQPDGGGDEIGKKDVLRGGDGEAELVDHVEREIALQIGRIEVLGEHEHQQHEEGGDDLTPGQTAHVLDVVFGLAPAIEGYLLFVPTAYPGQQPNGHHGEEGEPTDAALPVGNDDEGHADRADGTPHVAANLEYGLRHPFADTGERRLHLGRVQASLTLLSACTAINPTRCEARHLGGFGMENGRAHADEGHGDQHQRETVGHGEQQEACKGEAHAEDQAVGARMFVGEIAHHGLQERGGNLVGERDGANLHEAQSQRLLDHRVDGRDDGLEHIVQEMSQADHQQDGQRRFIAQIAHSRSTDKCHATGSDAFTENLLVEDDDIHALDIDALPHVFHHIGFGGQVLVDLLTALELHDQHGAYHPAILVEQTASAEDVLFHFLHACEVTGSHLHALVEAPFAIVGCYYILCHNRGDWDLQCFLHSVAGEGPAHDALRAGCDIAHRLVEGGLVVATLDDGRGVAEFTCPRLGLADHLGAQTLATVLGQDDDAPQHHAAVGLGIEAAGGYRQIVVHGHDVHGGGRVVLVELLLERNPVFSCHRLDANVIGSSAQGRGGGS